MTTDASQAGANTPWVEKIFHPTLLAPDLIETDSFFRRLFGCDSSPSLPQFKTIPETFGMFTVVRDVMIDTISPQRIKQMIGVDFFSSEGIPHLFLTGWYVDQDRIAELFHRLKDSGIRCVGPDGVVRDEPPIQGGDPHPATLNGRINYVTKPEDTGITYQFIPTSRGLGLDPARGSHIGVDHRLDHGWQLPPVDPNDPLGIDRCCYHTILTRNPERALKLVVDTLGGRIIHEGRNALRATTSTYVNIGDATFEYAVPDKGSPADQDWLAYPSHFDGEDKALDTYHAITWKVADIERVATHLEAQGIGIRARTQDTIITDPATSLGVPWGFTTQPIPGDPRWI